VVEAGQAERLCQVVRVGPRADQRFQDGQGGLVLLRCFVPPAPAALSEELGMTPAAIRQAQSRRLRRLKEEMGELLT
jgi:hypothetical protein